MEEKKQLILLKNALINEESIDYDILSKYISLETEEKQENEEYILHGFDGNHNILENQIMRKRPLNLTNNKFKRSIARHKTQYSIVRKNDSGYPFIIPVIRKDQSIHKIKVREYRKEAA